jgi:hypothetical protein
MTSKKSGSLQGESARMYEHTDTGMHVLKKDVEFWVLKR